MIKCLKIILILLSAVTAAYAANEKGLRIRPLAQEEFNLQPGQILDTTFRITNTTNKEYELIVDVKIPSNWKLITEEFPFYLASNQTKTRKLSVFIPETAPPGNYTIQYLARARKYPAIRDYYSINVNILSSERLTVRLIEIPEYVTAGDDYQASFSVTNKSNRERKIFIEMEDKQSSAFNIEPKNFKLKPGRSQLVTVNIRAIDKTEYKYIKYQRLKFTAKTLLNGGSKSTASVFCSTQIIPLSIDSQKEIPPSAENPKKKVTNAPGYLPHPSPPSADDKITIRLKNAKEAIQTKPRQIVTAVIAIKNYTKQTRQLILDMKLPEDWYLITKDFPFLLHPDQTVSKLVSFFVPQTAAAGQYKVTFIAKDENYPSLRDSCSAYVTVLPVNNLQVKLLEAPKYVIAGDQYETSFLVTNNGNVDYNVITEIYSAKKLPFSFQPKEFTLAPGQSKTVNVTVNTEKDINRKLKHFIRLTAQAQQKGETKIKAQSSTRIEILPRISGSKDKYHRIPSELKFTYVSENNADATSGLQVELQGQGTLDEERKKHIKFRFRGPDIQDESIFGRRDEYFLSYWTKDYELHLGDRSFSLSPLTENYLYGRGIEGILHIDQKFDLGAYYLQTRWLNTKTYETAAFINYLMDDKQKIGLNLLRKTRNEDTDYIFSLYSHLRPAKDTNLELEYALGPGTDYKDNAYLARLYGKNKFFSYYVKLNHAGPDYPGYYNDLDYISTGLTIPLNRRLRINAAFRREKNNLDLDPALYSAPLEKYYQLGLDYKIFKDTTVSIDFKGRDRKDRLQNPDFDYDEKHFRFALAQNLGRLTLNTAAESGKTKNYLTNQTVDTKRYTLSAYYCPNREQTYSGYLYYDDDSSFTGESKKSITIGANAGLEIAKKTSLKFSFQTNDYQSSSFGDRDNFQLKLTHTFKNDNKLSILARYTEYQNSIIEDETSMMLQYSVPVGIPVYKKNPSAPSRDLSSTNNLKILSENVSLH